MCLYNFFNHDALFFFSLSRLAYLKLHAVLFLESITTEVAVVLKTASLTV